MYFPRRSSTFSRFFGMLPTMVSSGLVALGPLFKQSTPHLRIADFPVERAGLEQLGVLSPSRDPAFLHDEDEVAV